MAVLKHPPLIQIKSLRVGVVHWVPDQTGDGIPTLLARTFAELGCEIIDFFYNEKLPKNLDAVFVYGPFGSLTPLVNQLLAYPPAERPLFILRLSEQLPNPDLPEWLRYDIGLIRSGMERLAYREERPGKWEPKPYLHWMTTRAHRFRYYGDLHWLHRQGLLSVLVIGSRLNGVSGDCLRARGIDPVVTGLGSHPAWGADLKLERDVPVLWIGKRGSHRRERLLERVRADLNKCGVEMLMVDGIEHPYAFGEERTVLLNRTKIVLNLLREQWDSNSLRYYLAAPNRALIVTEPVSPPNSFVPGVHLVETPVEEMADTICYYLSHEEERRQLTEQAYELISTDLTMKNGVARILERITNIRPKVSAGNAKGTNSGWYVRPGKKVRVT